MISAFKKPFIYLERSTDNSTEEHFKIRSWITWSDVSGLIEIEELLSSLNIILDKGQVEIDGSLVAFAFADTKDKKLKEVFLRSKLMTYANRDLLIQERGEILNSMRFYRRYKKLRCSVDGKVNDYDSLEEFLDYLNMDLTLSDEIEFSKSVLTFKPFNFFGHLIEIWSSDGHQFSFQTICQKFAQDLEDQYYKLPIEERKKIPLSVSII